MAQGQVAHFPWAWSWISFGIFELFFGHKWSLWTQNCKFFEKKMGKKGQKIAPEVADGHHGGLGRGKKAKNGLEVGHSFEIFDCLLWEICVFSLLILSTSNVLVFSVKKRLGKSLL